MTKAQTHIPVVPHKAVAEVSKSCCEARTLEQLLVFKIGCLKLWIACLCTADFETCWQSSQSIESGESSQGHQLAKQSVNRNAASQANFESSLKAVRQ